MKAWKWSYLQWPLALCMLVCVHTNVCNTHPGEIWLLPAFVCLCTQMQRRGWEEGTERKGSKKRRKLFLADMRKVNEGVVRDTWMRNVLKKEIGRKRKKERKKKNVRRDCAKHCYLLWQSQKSSPQSRAITTSPLSMRATTRVVGFTKRSSEHEQSKNEEEELEGAVLGRNKAGWLQLCCGIRLTLAGDFLRRSLPACYGPYEGINQGFTQTP